MRSETLQVRLSPDESARLRQAAARQGIYVAEFLRMAALEKAKLVLEPAPPNGAAVRRVV